MTADAPGTSTLTEQQQAVWLEKRGQHYLSVAEQPLRPSRRVRRALRFRGAARNVTGQDIALLQVQRDVGEQLRQATIRPVL